jgi:hypothetical protein
LYDYITADDNSSIKKNSKKNKGNNQISLKKKNIQNNTMITPQAKSKGNFNNNLNSDINNNNNTQINIINNNTNRNKNSNTYNSSNGNISININSYKDNNNNNLQNFCLDSFKKFCFETDKEIEEFRKKLEDNSINANAVKKVKPNFSYEWIQNLPININN